MNDLATPLNNGIHQSDRGGLWLQDNRQTSCNHFDYPPQSTTPIMIRLTVAGFGFRAIGGLLMPLSSSTSINHLSRCIIHFNHIQSDRGGLRLQDNRKTSHNYLDHPPTTINQFNPNLSDRGGFGFKTADDYFNHSSRSSSVINPPNQISLTVVGFTALGQSTGWSTIHLDHPFQTNFHI
ncbi:hypothetical protein N7516_005490 [Penicillium verrucosum]|uniref:uncharacterized protein n=1 Tax=Penicillium verrucosum TaxID=60171 RepID=UPI0025454714|nr:uncharacterized protein N7516_005490 [Penicillium verrucosum]KAJ5945322.1 hypothetical protein N7516_005490 [Penicillium verrucosum]